MKKILGLLFLSVFSFANPHVEEGKEVPPSQRHAAPTTISVKDFILRLNQEMKKTPEVKALTQVMNTIVPIIKNNEGGLTGLKVPTLSQDSPLEKFAYNSEVGKTRADAAVLLARALERSGKFSVVGMSYSDDRDNAPLILLQKGEEHYVLSVIGPPFRFTLAKNIVQKSKKERDKKEPTGTLDTKPIKVGEMIANRTLPNGTATSALKESEGAAQLRWNLGTDFYDLFYSTLRRNMPYMGPPDYFLESVLEDPLTEADKESLKGLNLDWTLPWSNN